MVAVSTKSAAFGSARADVAPPARWESHGPPWLVTVHRGVCRALCGGLPPYLERGRAPRGGANAAAIRGASYGGGRMLGSGSPESSTVSPAAGLLLGF